MFGRVIKCILNYANRIFLVIKTFSIRGRNPFPRRHRRDVGNGRERIDFDPGPASECEAVRMAGARFNKDGMI
jgi:hypothetical protein